MSNTPSSPVKRNHVGDSASMIYGLDSMTQKGFSQNILPEYSAKGSVHNCLGEGIGGVRKGVEWGMRCN